MCWVAGVFIFQAEDGIRDLVRSRGLGDVYKRQRQQCQTLLVFCGGEVLLPPALLEAFLEVLEAGHGRRCRGVLGLVARVVFGKGGDGLHDIVVCLLYTSDAADERSSVDLGGRRIIKKKKIEEKTVRRMTKK